MFQTTRGASCSVLRRLRVGRDLRELHNRNNSALRAATETAEKTGLADNGMTTTDVISTNE
jgi:hypothetical protein